MKKHAKVTLIRSFFLISALVGSVGYAAPESTNNLLAQPSYIASLNVSNNSDYPSMTHIVFDTSSALKPISLNSLPIKTLPGMQIADFAMLSPNKLRSHNSFFEFAAKFNDKLQQVLAFFDFSSKANTMSVERSADNKIQEISLHTKTKKIVHNGNCNAK